MRISGEGKGALVYIMPLDGSHVKERNSYKSLSDDLNSI